PSATALGVPRQVRSGVVMGGERALRDHDPGALRPLSALNGAEQAGDGGRIDRLDFRGAGGFGLGFHRVSLRMREVNTRPADGRPAASPCKGRRAMASVLRLPARRWMPFRLVLAGGTTAHPREKAQGTSIAIM